jgi:hypothetical protein
VISGLEDGPNRPNAHHPRYSGLQTEAERPTRVDSSPLLSNHPYPHLQRTNEGPTGSLEPGGVLAGWAMGDRAVPVLAVRAMLELGVEEPADLSVDGVTDELLELGAMRLEGRSDAFVEVRGHVADSDIDGGRTPPPRRTKTASQSCGNATEEA